MASPEERLPKATQESIAATIVLVDDDNARVIASIVDPLLFDRPFDDIVQRAVDYRKKYGGPPGKQHIDDVFADKLEDDGDDNKDRELYERLIVGMIRLSDNIDTKFILSRTSEFVRLKKMRAGIAQAAERYQKGGPDVFDDLEGIFRQTLRIRDKGLDYGFTLGDVDRSLQFLRMGGERYRLPTGIKELDIHGLQPAKKELFLFLAARNRGKSQWLHMCGRQAIQHRWKCIHYTLENSDDMTSMRYYQTLYNGVKRLREGGHHYAKFDNEDGDDKVHLRQVKFNPDWIMADTEKSESFLRNKIRSDPFLQNLRIRSFPTGQLTFEMLERDLDELSIVHKFEPDIILLDYPQMMKMPRAEKDYTALQNLTINLRGLAVERNAAVVIPQQGNRSSESASTVKGFMGGGSIEMLAVADNALTYSQTQSEEEHGLARLYAQKVRNDEARFTLCISQHYPSGQFCMDSWYMTKTLQEQVRQYVGYKSEEEEAEGDDDFKEQREYKRANAKAS